VCGPATARAIEINCVTSGSGPGVATIRELEQLVRVGASLRDLRVVVGQFGGMSALTRSVAQELRSRGAKVIAVDELDPSMQATAANRHAANVYIGFEAHAVPKASVAFYATEGFRSAGGEALAGRLRHALARVAGLGDISVAGMRLAVLRETRMTAVVCSLGPVQRIRDAAPAISDAVVAALAAWAESPTVMAPAH
jgi:N-acetylmuramoyl-L-alanine amidase